MPVLANFLYPQGAKFALQRQYLPAFAIGWQAGSFALQSGRYTILEEVIFGGYRLHIKIKEWVWDWDNRGFTLDDIFEDYYALAPGGTTPINAGDVYISYQIEPNFLVPLLTISNVAPVSYYYFQSFPSVNRPYWTPVRALTGTPFWYP